MKKLLRLMGYVQPYWLQAITSVILMAGVGLLDAFRLLLVGPIFERVLNPDAPNQTIPLLAPRFLPARLRCRRLQRALLSMPCN